MKSLLVLVLLLGLYTSTLIYENIPKNFYRELIKKDLINIQEMNSMQSFVFPDDTEEDIDKGLIKIEKVKPFLTVINPDMMTYSVSERNEVQLFFSRKDNEISCLIMSFNCEYSNAAGVKSTATFSITAKEYSFIKTYKQYEGDNFFIPTAKAEIAFEIANVSVNNSQIISKDSFTALLQKYIKKIAPNLLTEYNANGISAYYTRGILNKEIKHIHVNKGTSIGKNTIILTPDKAPLIKENVVINNYNGNINNLADKEDPLDIESNEYFIAVNKKILQSIINENLFSYKMEDSQKPIQDYSLNIQSASKICEGLKDEKEQVLKILQEIKSVTIDMNNFLSGKAVIQTDLKSTTDERVLLSFNIELGIKFEMTLFQNGLNFRLKAHEIVINSITVNPQPERKITNEDLLRKWILDSFKVYFINTEYNLFGLSIDLNDYFTNVKSIKQEKNYLVIQ